MLSLQGGRKEERGKEEESKEAGGGRSVFDREAEGTHWK